MLTGGDGNWQKIPKTKIKKNENGYYVTSNKIRYFIGEGMLRPRLVQKSISEDDMIESKNRKLSRRRFQVYYIFIDFNLYFQV